MNHGKAHVIPIKMITAKNAEQCSNNVIGMLDEIEKRVERFRESAISLEQDREVLLALLNNFRSDPNFQKLGEAACDDITATAVRLSNRCKSVEITVNTPRNAQQVQALDNVNSMITSLVKKMEDNISQAKEKAKSFFNACSPDSPDGPIDHQFQAQIIDCTADDQKNIRTRLSILIDQIERTQNYIESL